MALLRLPQPFDFEVSTERFRAFGPDLANLWHEGGLHRVVGGARGPDRAGGGRRRRRAARRRRPSRSRASCSAPSSTSTAFYAWVEPGRPRPEAARRRAARLPAAARARPVRDARDLDHRAAGLALRRVRDPQPADRALRRAAPSTPTPSRPRRARRRDRGRARRDRLLAAQGRVRARARPRRARLDALAALPDEEVQARARRRSAASASGRSTGSSRATSRGRAPGRPATSACARRSRPSTLTAPRSRPRRCARWRAIRAVPEPDRALPAHRAARGGRMTIRDGDDGDCERGVLRPRWSRDLGAAVAGGRPPRRLVRRQDRARRRGGRRAGRRSPSRRTCRGRVGHVHVVYVVPERRRRGVAKALLASSTSASAPRGSTHVTLDADLSNRDGLAAWRRLGFSRLVGPARRPRSTRSTRGSPATPPSRISRSIHVQSDDEAAVADAVRKYVPRFGRSAGSAVSRPRNGWIAVYDDLVDRDRAARRRLSQELSIALGARRLHDLARGGRGRALPARRARQRRRRVPLGAGALRRAAARRRGRARREPDRASRG